MLPFCDDQQKDFLNKINAMIKPLVWSNISSLLYIVVGHISLDCMKLQINCKINFDAYT